MLSGLFNSLFPARDDAEQLARKRLDAWSTWLLPLAGEGGVGRDPGYEGMRWRIAFLGERLVSIRAAASSLK